MSTDLLVTTHWQVDKAVSNVSTSLGTVKFASDLFVLSLPHHVTNSDR